MPESKPRKRPAFTPPPRAATIGAGQNPRWYAPVMVTLMLIGLAWIVTSYVTQLAYPIPDIGAWNIAAGFVVVLSGFAMVTRWK